MREGDGEGLRKDRRDGKQGESHGPSDQAILQGWRSLIDLHETGNELHLGTPTGGLQG